MTKFVIGGLWFGGLRIASPPASAVTRSIYVGTFVAIAIVATLSVVIYLGSLSDAAEQHAQQQLATLRTAAVGVEAEVQSLAARLKQFSSLPSVQSVDVPYVGQRIEAAFGDSPNEIIRYVVRIDAGRRLYSWTPDGELQDKGIPAQVAESDWQQVALAGTDGPARMSKLWWLRDPPPNFRAVILPVYRTSPSAQLPVPPNDLRDATLLSKPFSPSALVKTARAVLDGPLSSPPASQR